VGGPEEMGFWEGLGVFLRILKKQLMIGVATREAGRPLHRNLQQKDPQRQTTQTEAALKGLQASALETLLGECTNT
jgi:hypothetical protein